MSIFLNNTFLEKYYIFKKESILKETYTLVNSLYNSNGDIELEFEKLARMSSIHTVIADKDFTVLYDSITSRRDNENRNLKPGVPDNSENNEAYFRNRSAEILSQKIILGNRVDKRLKTSFLSLTGVLDNGKYILLTLPIATIEESASVANEFFLLTGIITLLFGVFLLFLLLRS